MLEDLAFFPGRSERIEALIALADEYRNFGHEEVPRNAATRVPGCESEVYFASQPTNDGLQFRFAVDNPQGMSAMALAVILQKTSGLPYAVITAIPEDLVFQIFGRELSMGKSQGLTNMVASLRAAAARLAG